MKFKKINVIYIIIILSFFLFFTVYKISKTGNNIINKSTKDIIENIFNISSYEAELEVTINSNKTTNKYLLKQYYQSPNFSKQIIQEPNNIKDVEIIYEDNKLEIKNVKLSLNKIYNNYNYINKNILWLSYLIKNLSKDYKIEEIENEIIIEGKIENEELKETIYIDKKTGLPKKLEIIDNNNKCKIYIEYKEIKLNNIQK